MDKSIKESTEETLGNRLAWAYRAKYMTGINGLPNAEEIHAARKAKYKHYNRESHWTLGERWIVYDYIVSLPAPSGLAELLKHVVNDEKAAIISAFSGILDDALKKKFISLVAKKIFQITV